MNSAKDTIDFDLKDIPSLEKALNDSSAKVSTLWVSFIIFIVFMTLTIGSVTHKDLLLNSPVKVPIFNVPISLLGLFVVAPFLVLSFHAYFLTLLRNLLERLDFYYKCLSDKLIVGPDWHLIQLDRCTVIQRLDNFVFVQLWASANGTARGDIFFLLLFIAVTTSLVAPLVLLVQIQLTFLPYHSEAATWVHRATILLDAALVSWFVLGIVPRTRASFLVLILSVVVIGMLGIFSTCIAIFPGERIYLYARSSVSEMLFETELPFLSNVLVIKGVDLITTKEANLVPPETGGTGSTTPNEKKMREPSDTGATLKENRKISTVSLSGRDLRNARLSRSNLTGADLTDADLSGADLSETILRWATITCTTHSGDGPCAYLDGANLRAADLEHANLEKARLRGANLTRANLSNARLRFARLDGADLSGTIMKGTKLEGAHLTGASLNRPNFENAIFSETNFDYAHIVNLIVPEATYVIIPEAPNSKPTSLAGAIVKSVCFSSSLNDCATPDGSSDSRMKYWAPIPGNHWLEENRLDLPRHLIRMILKEDRRGGYIADGMKTNDHFNYLISNSGSACAALLKKAIDQEGRRALATYRERYLAFGIEKECK